MTRRRLDPKTSKTAPAQRRVAGGFDLSGAVRDVACDMVHRLPDLAHIDMSRVCVACSPVRKRVSYGVQASLTPLRFEGGALEGIRRGRRYRVQRVVDDQGREMLYILTLYLPRFMDLVFREKLITILHELWHISPAFDGDIRRHAGRCYAHSHSREAYDAEMGRLADRWLALKPALSLYGFLHQSFDALSAQHGSLYGLRVARPKLIPVESNGASRAG